MAWDLRKRPQTIQVSKKRRDTNTEKAVLSPSGSSASTPDGLCHLLDLPPELRLCIYDTVFESLAVTDNNQELEFYTALLYTNKQIFSEAISSFHKHEKQLSSRLHSEWFAAYEETRRVESSHLRSGGRLPRGRIRPIEPAPAHVPAVRGHQTECWLRYGRAKDRSDIVDELRVEIEFLDRVEGLRI